MGRHKKLSAEEKRLAIAYKAEGHTHKEVAEKFGISEATSMNIAKGVAPQKSAWNIPKEHLRNQWSDVDQADRARQIIDERHPEYEYAGNYTGSNGTADLKCKRCGHIRTVAWVTVRHYDKIICHNCERLKRENKKREAAAIRSIEKEQRYFEKHATQIELKICPVCFSLFSGNRKYCSGRCSTKVADARRSDRRMRKISHAIVDKNITLNGLAIRDNNVCWLCGGLVDWNDIELRDGTKIAGDYYPSIDHVIPLAAGGLHAWDNVKLAHRICNYLKSDSLLPLVHESPEKTLGTGGVTVLELSARETKTGQLMLIC